ncbi:Fur family transcriptional regulator [Pelosinus sp. sgz500959]|uniref:Fur family transcriptional regulator n=1 Tax=Pelosinus sp. sgz500959 TaxID=3242472 RepID=UPI00366DFCF1
MEICITSLLREKGFKVTPQRLAIYNMLASTHSHPNAEMIFNELQAMYPTMSLATVYKTMEILKEIGLVKILNAGEDSFRYDADTSDHPHVRCMECGQVEDVDNIDSVDFVKQVAQGTNYKLVNQQFYFYGICPSCQRKELN